MYQRGELLTTFVGGVSYVSTDAVYRGANKSRLIQMQEKVQLPQSDTYQVQVC